MIGEPAQSPCSAPVRSAPRGAAAQISSEPRQTPTPKQKGSCGAEKAFPGAGGAAKLPARCLLSLFPAGWCLGGRVRGGCTGCACPYRCARRGGMPTTESRPPSRPSWDKARPHLGTDLTSTAPTSAPPSPASPRAPPGPKGGSEGRTEPIFRLGGHGNPSRGMSARRLPALPAGLEVDV